MTFDLTDYVDVAERIRIFKAEFNEGILQSEVTFVDGGVLCKAYAYRFELDTRPGIGHAFEPIPGSTPYTRNSEVMNAETSAWGRAIAALGFDFKSIASAEEVRNRSAGEGTESASEPTVASPAEPNPAEKAQAAAERRRAETAPQDDGKPENVRIHFGKNGPTEENPQGTRLGDLTKRQLSWYANEWDPDKDPKYPATPKDRRLKLAAQLVNTGGGTAEELMRALEADSIPF